MIEKSRVKAELQVIREHTRDLRLKLGEVLDRLDRVEKLVDDIERMVA